MVSWYGGKVFWYVFGWQRGMEGEETVVPVSTQ